MPCRRPTNTSAATATPSTTSTIVVHQPPPIITTPIPAIQSPIQITSGQVIQQPQQQPQPQLQIQQQAAPVAAPTIQSNYKCFSSTIIDSKSNGSPLFLSQLYKRPQQSHCSLQCHHGHNECSTLKHTLNTLRAFSRIAATSRHGRKQ